MIYSTSNFTCKKSRKRYIKIHGNENFFFPEMIISPIGISKTHHIWNFIIILYNRNWVRNNSVNLLFSDVKAIINYFCGILQVALIYNYGLLRRWTSRIVNLWGLFSRGLYPEGKQPSQVDNSGFPSTKMAIIVFSIEQRTKSDTFMTTV
jgi:hypothetical protein